MLDKAPRFITEAMKAVEALLTDLDSLQKIVDDAQVKAAVTAAIPNGATLVNDLLQDYANLTGDLCHGVQCGRPRRCSARRN